MSDMETKGKKKSTCLMWGCGCALLLALIAGAGTYWVVENARSIGADLATTVFEAVLDEAQLDAADHSGIMSEVHRVRDAFKEEIIEMAQLETFFTELKEGPLLPLAGVLVARRVYLDNSDLPEAEIVEGTLNLERLARGIYEKQIDHKQLEQITEMLFIGNGDNVQPKDAEDVTTEDLREFLKRAKQAADDAEISQERFDIDLVAEVKKAVDAILPE